MDNTPPMKDLNQYQAEDFIADRDFIRWVLENKPDDALLWQQWLLQHPHEQNAIEEARAVVLSLKIREEGINEEKMHLEIQQILAVTKKKSSGLLFSISHWKYKYAAILIVAVTAGIVLYNVIRPGATDNVNLADKDLPQKTNDITEEINTTDEKKTVRLADGSTIHLSPNAVIRYSRQFTTGTTRDIYLSGEAFFEVSKDPNKPFRVFSHELITKVLGTSFTIKANEGDKQISVVVRTGKVSVYNSNNEKDREGINSQKLTGVVLTPNQELVFSRDGLKFQKTLIEKPVLINPAEVKNDFQYEDVPVAEVFEQLEKAFGIDIVYDKETIKNCKITADLDDESIYKKLELICRVMDARYDIIDGQITIQARPCD
jgi:ferric-dicitrate binding protein FerR (iron transport regulator)